MIKNKIPIYKLSIFFGFLLTFSLSLTLLWYPNITAQYPKLPYVIGVATLFILIFDILFRFIKSKKNRRKKIFLEGLFTILSIGMIVFLWKYDPSKNLGIRPTYLSNAAAQQFLFFVFIPNCIPAKRISALWWTGAIFVFVHLPNYPLMCVSGLAVFLFIFVYYRLEKKHYMLRWVAFVLMLLVHAHLGTLVHKNKSFFHMKNMKIAQNYIDSIKKNKVD